MENTFFKRAPLGIGQKIERIRTFRGFKQEYLASKLGVSQQTVSNIEQQEEIEDELLVQIAQILEVSPEVIKNFDEDRITYNINNMYHIHGNDFKIHDNEMKDNASGSFNAQQFNSDAKIIELYERLLKTQEELFNIKNQTKKEDN